MVSGITPCARECKWIVYFGETPKSLVPKISWACCASCTLIAPSSLRLELRGREHNNCMSWLQIPSTYSSGPSEIKL